MIADILREKFLNFFKAKKHKIVESDSLVPAGDPTVLFTPAGMNQFKKELLGFDSGFKRAATSQRCLRTDDLDKVGKTSGHHTFFEMLGNFSFGDYFKQEAITWAWEFLTRELEIGKENLWVSVYKDDDEAYNIWKDSIKIPQEKILRLTDKENFWPSEAKEKGPNGPCGPCSEIFFDQGQDLGCKKPDCNPICSCGRFVEVWNLVFTQYNRKEGGSLEPLPKKNIDTGMGLERLAAVMQGVHNNFETDLFKPLVKEITGDTRTPPNKAGGKPGHKDTREAVYALADHIRAITFSIFDGVLPSNEARGYVVRKLIRKSVLHLRSLGIEKPFLYKLVPIVAEIMNNPYPELSKRKENIAEVILAEEKSFINTLNSGDSILKEKFRGFSEKQDADKAGKVAFQLYDTYGIPLELTQGWLDKQGISISKQAFENELQEQKNRSKLQSAMKGDVFDTKGLGLNLKESNFVGFKEYSCRGKILAIIKDNAEAKKISEGESVNIILEKTPFYPESGGQIGDTGELIRGKNVFQVSDTRKSGKAIVHIGKVKSGSFKKNDSVLANIDAQRRLSIARNHTATHLLQAALRKVLGTHVQQQGSFVGEKSFRFDFTHFKDLNQEQLGRIEEVVYRYVINNYPVNVKSMPLQEARKTGALAFFGEKYEGKVRIISIDDFSKEFCGGTHLDTTGKIGLFKITQESSVASGVRRIEAVTGTFAYDLIKQEEAVISDICAELNAPLDKLAEELEKKISRIKELERLLNAKHLDTLKSSVDSFLKEAQEIKGLKFIARIIKDADMNSLRKTVDLIKEKTSSPTIIALGGVLASGSALVVIGTNHISQELIDKGLDATRLIKEIAPEIGGSGGGRKDFAQAGGNNPGNLEKSFGKLKTIIEGLI